MKKILITFAIIINVSLYSNPSFAVIVDCDLHGIGEVGSVIADNEDVSVMRNACFDALKNSTPATSAAHLVAHGITIEGVEINVQNPTYPECFTGHKDIGYAGGR